MSSAAYTADKKGEADDMNAAEVLLDIHVQGPAAAPTIPGPAVTGFPTGAIPEASHFQYHRPPADHYSNITAALGVPASIMGGGDTTMTTMAAAAPASTRKPKKAKAKHSAQPKSRRDKFPQKLMEILSNEDYAETISWLPHGRSFLIHSPERFTENILPHYFKECKFASFTRKLYRWGFRQISKGPDAESFFHKMFRRDKPELCSVITCGKEIRDGCPELHGGINAESLMRLEEAELRANVLQQRKEALARHQLAEQTALRNQTEFAHSAAAAHATNLASIGSHGLPPARPTTMASGYAGVGYARYDPLTGLPIGLHPGSGLLSMGRGTHPTGTRAEATSSAAPITAAGVLGARTSIFASRDTGPYLLDSERLTTLAPNADPVTVQQRLDAMSERILLLKRRQLQALQLREQELQRLEQLEYLRFEQQLAAAAPSTGLATASTCMTLPPAAQHTISHSVEIPAPAPAALDNLSVPTASAGPVPPAVAVADNACNKADSAEKDT